MTQEQLAERAGINVKTIQGVEQGRTEPELRTMRKLARTLGTTMDALEGSAKKNAGRGPDALVAKIEADLRRLPPTLLHHVAGIVHVLVERSKR